MESKFYNRQCQPIEHEEWSRLFEDNIYQRVAHDVIDEDAYVSTIWLGHDPFDFRSEEPLIFETMLFRRRAEPLPDQRSHDAIGPWRYATEQEAIAGHKQAVASATRRDDDLSQGLILLRPIEK